MQNISRDCHRRVLPGKRHSGRTLYAKAQSEPYAREENITPAAFPPTYTKHSAPAILSPGARGYAARDGHTHGLLKRAEMRADRLVLGYRVGLMKTQCSALCRMLKSYAL